MQNVNALADYKRTFAEARDMLAENRREQQIDDDYYHGYQLTAEERRVLQSRRQPDTVFNRYRKAINGTLGVLKQGTTDPRAYGRNPGVDEDSADVASKVLRYSADVNNFDALKIECAYDYLVPGVTALLIEVDEKRRPKLTQIHWEEFFYDPRSRRADFSDARYLGIAKWMYADDVAAMYPEKKDEVETALAEASPIDDTFEDRPRDSLSNWIDRRRHRMMVVELYQRYGQSWKRCVFHAGGILEESESPYLGEDGKPSCAIEAQACYVDRENNRIGIGRDMRSPQDEFNKRRQKLLHMATSRPVQVIPNGDAMQFALSVDADEVRKEASRPDGVIPAGWQPVPMTDLASGQVQLLAMAEGEMDREGPNPAILGRQGETQSGRAQLVRQQAGHTEQAVIFGGIEAWELRVYRAMWNRCRQFWTAPDYVRVTDDIGAPQFIGINQPVTQQVPAIVMDPATGQPTAGVQTVILGYENQLAELDVDIMLDTVPDTAALADEQFQALAELAKVYGPQEVPFDDLLEVSSIPEKRKLIEKRKARAEQQAQSGGMAQQLQAAGAVAEIENTQADTRLKDAQTDKAMVDAEMKAFETGFRAMQPEKKPAAGAQ